MKADWLAIKRAGLDVKRDQVKCKKLALLREHGGASVYGMDFVGVSLSRMRSRMFFNGRLE